MSNEPPAITYSIVSHGQGALVDALLTDFKDGVDLPYAIMLTLNIPEDETFLLRHEKLPLTIIRNEAPLGFGANHNQAFLRSNCDFFAVVNPDIRVKNFSINSLIISLSKPNVGVVAPAVISSDGIMQDNARKFPTISRLLLRKIRPAKIDYSVGQEDLEVDWVAGMFMMFRRETYRGVGGFDEDYFMYLEDADICRRLHSVGRKVILVPSVQVIHNAQRASRHKLRHLSWHLRSTIIFLMRTVS